MATAALLAATVITAEPQCFTDLASCYYGFAEARFGNAVDVLRTLGTADEAVGSWERLASMHDAACDPSLWHEADACHERCPLRLEVTSPPRFAGTFCVQDNDFAPYNPQGHMDSEHPLNGVELVFAAVGTERVSRYGCTEGVYDGRDYRNTIALVSRGGCAFENKMQLLAQSGAAVGVLVNNYLDNEIVDQLIAMEGDSAALQAKRDLLAVTLPKHYGDVMFAAMDAGVELRGRLRMVCADADATGVSRGALGLAFNASATAVHHRHSDDRRGAGDQHGGRHVRRASDRNASFADTDRPMRTRQVGGARARTHAQVVAAATRAAAGRGAAALQTEGGYPWDACPDSRLLTVCYDEADPGHRLCARCPLWLDPLGFEKPVCLWGNRLLPAKNENLLWRTLNLPMYEVSGTVVVVRPGGMADGGCAADDWAIFKQRIDDDQGRRFLAVLPLPDTCLPYEAVRLAQAAGVQGVVLMSPPSAVTNEFITGHSKFVNIAAHSIGPEDFYDVLAAAKEHGARFGNVGFALGSTRLYPGGMPATLPPTTATPGPPPTPGDDGNGNTTGNATVYPFPLPEIIRRKEVSPVGDSPTAMVCILLVIILILALLLKSIYQYRQAVDGSVLACLETKEEAQERMCLTIPISAAGMGLSFLVLAVTVTVSFVMANSAGREVTRAAFEDSRQSVRETIRASASQLEMFSWETREVINTRVARGVEQVLLQGAQHTHAVAGLYSSLDSRAPMWSDFDALYPTFVQVNLAHPATWTASVYLKNGYYASNHFKTDDRENDQRGDGVAAPVTLTRNGFLYGYQRMWYVPQVKQSATWFTVGLWEHNAFTRVGSEVGNPLNAAARVTGGGLRWHVSRASWPNIHQLATGSEGIPTAVGLPISVFTPVVNRAGADIGVVEVRVPLATLNNVVMQTLEAIGGGDKVRDQFAIALFELGTYDVLATNTWQWHAAPLQFRRPGEHVFVSHKLHTLFDVPVPALNSLGRLMSAANIPDTAHGALMHVDFDEQDGAAPPETLVFVIAAEFGNRVADVGGAGWRVEDPGAVPTEAALGRHIMRFDGTAVLRIDQNITTTTPSVAATRRDNPDGSWNSTDAFFQHGVMTLADGVSCPTTEFSAPGVGTERHCLYREFLWDKPYTVSLRVKPDATIPAEAVTRTTPRLFSNTAVGDADIRIFGNGQMFMGVFSYGCRTGATGLPAGRWTTITAVADYQNRECLVYMNGVLASTGPLRASFRPDARAEQFVVGAKFVGVIDRVVVHRAAIDREGAGALYRAMAANGPAALPSPDLPPRSRNWTSDVMRIRTPQSREASGPVVGVHWALALAYPTSDITGYLEEVERITLQNLYVHEANRRDVLERSTGEALLIAAVLVFFAMLVISTLNDIFTDQFAELACVMCEIALMQTEDIPTMRSRFRELNTVCRSLQLMINALREYHAFFPLTLTIVLPEDEGEPAAVMDARMLGNRVSITPLNGPPEGAPWIDDAAPAPSAEQAPAARVEVLNAGEAVVTPMALRPKLSALPQSAAMTGSSPTAAASGQHPLKYPETSSAGMKPPGSGEGLLGAADPGGVSPRGGANATATPRRSPFGPGGARQRSPMFLGSQPTPTAAGGAGRSPQAGGTSPSARTPRSALLVDKTTSGGLGGPYNFDIGTLPGLFSPQHRGQRRSRFSISGADGMPGLMTTPRATDAADTHATRARSRSRRMSALFSPANRAMGARKFSHSPSLANIPCLPDSGDAGGEPGDPSPHRYRLPPAVRRDTAVSETSHQVGAGSAKASQVSIALQDDSPRAAAGAGAREQVIGSIASIRTAQLALGLVPRRMSFVQVNICGFHDLIRGMNGDDIIALHTNVLLRATTAFRVNKGMPEIFSGDRFACSFNAIGGRTCVRHRHAACRVAMLLHDTCAESHDQLKITAAVTSGMVRAGNLGNREVKRYSYVGSLVPWTHALERYARHVEAGVVVGPVVRTGVEDEFQFRHVGLVEYTKHSHSDMLVSELVNVRTGGGWDPAAGEQVTQGQGADDELCVVWNKWAMAIIEGRWKDAERMLDAVALVHVHCPYFHVFEEALTARHYEAFRVELH